MKLFFWFILVFCIQITVVAQPPTGTLLPTTGPRVEFYFYSLNDQFNGITYDDFTTLRLEYDDPAASSSGWRLKVKAMSDLEGVFSGTTMSPDVIELRVRQGVTENLYVLSTVSQIIASGPEISSHTEDIIISYDVGKTNSINVSSTDKYTIELLFELEAAP